jgi:DNA-binding winged helix-turn-helix (wHTH) protein/Tol biopolymer transport system component
MEETLSAHADIKRFGRFEVDLRRKELRRGGLLIRLQGQPFTLLALLVQRPNEVVSRMEMRQVLWGEDVTVDFEQSLSSVIKKLRESLDDSASNPVFIETIARHGYRFIAPVTSVFAEDKKIQIPQTQGGEGQKAALPIDSEFPEPSRDEPILSASPEQKIAAAPLKKTQSPSVYVWLSLAGVCALLVWAAFWSGQHSASTTRYRLSPVTSSSHLFTGIHYANSVPTLLTDGVRVYFPEFDGGQSLLSSALIGNGESNRIPLPTEINMPIPTDISPDLTRLLVTDRLGLTPEHPLWIVPLGGGGAQRINNTLAHDAIWTNDGRHVLFAKSNGIYREGDDGEELQLLATLPASAFWLRLSPDGKRIRFTINRTDGGDRSIWEMNSDGTAPHPIMAKWQIGRDVCCGSWTGDGKHFIFNAVIEGHSDLWEYDESAFDHWGWHPLPHRLTDGPMDFQSPIPDRHSSEIFAVGVQKSSRQIRFDPATHQVAQSLPLPPNVQRVEFSADGEWMAWVDGETKSLWRSRADGSLRLQLTTPPNEVWMMKWSPDNTRIAYIGRTKGSPWRIHIISSSGRQSSTPLPEDRDQVDVGWSPNGEQLIFGRLPNSIKVEEQPKRLQVFDLHTQRLSQVPDSEGVTSPRISPDGKYIAAIKNDGGELLLFEMESKKRRILLNLSITDPVWSHDSRALFFLAFQPEGRTIYRLRLPEEKLERVIGIEDIRLNDIGVFWFHSLAPGDLPLISLDTSNTSIYKLEQHP